MLLETNNLTKVYRNKKVVNDLNLSIEKGGIYGFIVKMELVKRLH